MAELADALDSGSSRRLVGAGSSPVSRTKALKTQRFQGFFLCFFRKRESSDALDFFIDSEEGI